MNFLVDLIEKLGGTHWLINQHVLPMFRYDAPLCFANATDFRQRALAFIDAETEPVRDTGAERLDDDREAREPRRHREQVGARSGVDAAG